MEETIQTIPSTEEATMEQTDDFREPIPRMPRVGRWKSALIKTVGATFVLISAAVYIGLLITIWIG